jgi:hypothetical protein
VSRDAATQVCKARRLRVVCVLGVCSVRHSLMWAQGQGAGRGPQGWTAEKETAAAPGLGFRVGMHLFLGGDTGDDVNQQSFSSPSM